MTAALYFSRARLRAGLGRLGPILFPSAPESRIGVSHRLVWSLFPENLTERPFLYRDTAPLTGPGRTARGEFLILSTLPPSDTNNLFDLETKSFEPALHPGDRLGFSLRANPTIHSRDRDRTTAGGRRKTRRHDVVMHALHAIPPGARRAAARPALIRDAGLQWLAAQGECAGFRLPDPNAISVDGYEQVAINVEHPRAGGGRRQPRHSRVEFEGVLEVVDPTLFLSRLAAGFGRARAFGHGLMLIRRV